MTTLPTEETTTTPLIPNGDDDDITPEEICEVAVNSVDESDPNAAVPVWAGNLYSAKILVSPGEDTIFALGEEPVVVALTGAQDGWISKLIIESTGDCGNNGITVLGEVPTGQSNPIYLPMIDLMRDAFESGSLTGLAHDPKTNTFTAIAAHDENAEGWLVKKATE